MKKAVVERLYQKGSVILHPSDDGAGDSWPAISVVPYNGSDCISLSQPGEPHGCVTVSFADALALCKAIRTALRDAND